MIDEGLRSNYAYRFFDNGFSNCCAYGYLFRTNGYANDINKEKVTNEIYMSDGKVAQKMENCTRHPIKKA